MPSSRVRLNAGKTWGLVAVTATGFLQLDHGKGSQHPARSVLLRRHPPDQFGPLPVKHLLRRRRELLPFGHRQPLVHRPPGEQHQPVAVPEVGHQQALRAGRNRRRPSPGAVSGASPSGDHLHSADCSLFMRNCLSGFAARNAAAYSSRFCRRRSFSRFCSATPGSWSASQYRTSRQSPISTRRSGGACRVAFQSFNSTIRSMVTNSCRAWARSSALSSYFARSGRTNGVFCVFGLP